MGDDPIIYIFSDGASHNNGRKDPDKPMFGAYGSLIVNGDSIKEFSGWFEDTTNNQNEMYGFIKAYMEFLNKYKSNKRYKIVVVSDSQYLINNINQNLNKWKNKNWKLANGNPVKNLKLWKIVDYLILNTPENITLEFIWQKGHIGKKVTEEEDTFVYFNERCDTLATEEIKKATDPNKMWIVPDNQQFDNIIDNIITLFNIE